MRTWLRMIFLSGVLSAAGANADTRGPGWEFGADLLYQDSNDLTFDGGTTANIDEDFGIALQFGYRFNSRWELNFAFDWQTIDYDATLVSGLLPNLSVDISGDLEIFTPRMNGVFNFIDGPLTPYVTAGIGWNFIDTNIPTSRVQVGCWWDPWWGYICTPYQSTKSTDAFEYSAGVGLRWDATPGLSMRFGYEKHWMDLSGNIGTEGFDQLKLGAYYRY
jgi:opacity protein-like surface antigen